MDLQVLTALHWLSYMLHPLISKETFPPWFAVILGPNLQKWNNYVLDLR